MCGNSKPKQILVCVGMYECNHTLFIDRPVLLDFHVAFGMEQGKVIISFVRSKVGFHLTWLKYKKRTTNEKKFFYIYKNYTHTNKVGTPQNFLLALIDELWKTWKIRILKKWKKIAGDIIILHMCTKNHNHMRYSSWDTKWDRIFCHFGSFFAFLTPSPINKPQNQNF